MPWLVRSLGEATRREVYLAARGAGRPVTRAEIAETVRIGRRLAAFHLDKLAAEGLLDVHYARPGDRAGGPGAGRPAKWYRTSGVQVDVTIPPRRHDLAASIMALAFDQLGPDGPHRDALLEQAQACGRDLAAASPTHLLARLTEIGYEPVSRPDGAVEMRNCPFHAVVEVARDTACPMNHALLTTLTSTQQPGRYDAVLEPTDGRCCVILKPAPHVNTAGRLKCF